MMRVGLGYDIHRLEEGRKLVIGGVTIPHDKGLAGHSDGDALAHAIMDALFGAAAMGNIGTHFPDTAQAYKNADSMALLVNTARLIKRAGYRIVNLDTNIIAQEPKLNPFVDAMRARIAECLDIESAAVSVKPRTNEWLGPEGRCEAIRTQAIVLLERSKHVG